MSARPVNESRRLYAPPYAPSSWICLAGLVALSLATRIPQLLSPNLLLDGDECTLGLMAKHLAHGKEFPMFFYGQHYGFSSVEALAGALSFILFGTGPLQLKLAMLALWTAGVAFLFMALSFVTGTWRSFWIAAALVLNPAWAVWSMKARGGYLTSFTATAALLWLLQDQGRRSVAASAARWLFAGVLLSVVYLAQPLWLPGVLPILVAALVSQRTYGALCGLALPAATILLIRTGGAISLGNPDPIGSLPALGRQIYLNLTGAYYLRWAVDPPGPATQILALLWCGMLATAGLMALDRILSRPLERFGWLLSRMIAQSLGRGSRDAYSGSAGAWFSGLLACSVYSTIVVEWLLFRPRDARYLLPLSGFLVPLAGLELANLVDRRALSKRTACGLTTAVLVLGALSMQEFRHFTYLWKNPPGSLTEAARLRQLVAYLKDRDARHVFSMNGLLEWQLMFYSNETVLARYQFGNDRYTPYVDEVDRALASGAPVAVVGYANTSGAPGCSDVPACTGGIERMVSDPRSVFTVDDKYFVYVGATRALLERLHFRFTD